jgi:hypothetical protein
LSKGRFFFFSYSAEESAGLRQAQPERLLVCSGLPRRLRLLAMTEKNRNLMSKIRSRLTLPKLGCSILYLVFGALISLFFMINAALGDCPTENDCISETTRALMFYGVPLMLAVGGVLLIRLFMRDKN